MMLVHGVLSLGDDDPHGLFSKAPSPSICGLSEQDLVMFLTLSFTFLFLGARTWLTMINAAIQEWALGVKHRGKKRARSTAVGSSSTALPTEESTHTSFAGGALPHSRGVTSS